MNRHVVVACLAAALLVSSGCATLTGPKTQAYYVNSNPSGAEVRVDGESRGRTPVTLDLEKTRLPIIEVSAPGFRSTICRVSTSIEQGYLLADSALCLFLFPAGCISFIDASGAWNRYDPPKCTVTLEADGQ